MAGAVKSLDEVFAQLAHSAFRRRFRLAARERDYLRARGKETVLMHARAFVAERLAPAAPANDGKQTPMRHHPVFIAQHATGTCCRSCLEKWHGIAKGRRLEEVEKQYVIEVIKAWLVRQER